MEKWTQWKPLEDSSGKYTIDSFVWSESGISILLSSTQNLKKLEIKFEDFVDTYRRTDIIFCPKRLADISSRYGAEFYINWTFFKITNSKYIDWIIEKSYKREFIHFCIIGNNEILDIVNSYEPKINFI